ncbi:AzlD domain-containing protein [Acuticoccus sp. MNP-M23]|uniref:AzlD domain-containing protein n=1 Tax=Acuticoccus sp. MNP-M23 TaxID=3072793 RepID=UPI0028149D07|nr:AzlD domain-containing protein [Acuticoccus sp. MNP-M23]WMS42448.1 AzlD domain-containing protein [Acuticoccus sp. MNP-M23]
MTVDLLPLILLGGLITYGARAGGYIFLSRFKSVPRRVEVGLDAVPAAVMTALAAPALISGTWREAVVIVFAALVSLRFGFAIVVFAPVFLLIALRAYT